MPGFSINLIVLGFLFAGMAHASVLLWLLGHPARNPMKRALCIWEAIGFVWHCSMGADEIFKLNAGMQTFLGLSEDLWSRCTQTLSMLTCVAVIHFIYSIMQRPRGRGFMAWTVYLVVLALYFALHPTAHHTLEVKDLLGAVGPLACYFFVIGLMIYTGIRQKDSQLRMRVLFTTIGLGGAVVIFTIFGKILPTMTALDAQTMQGYIMIFNGGWISCFVLVAAVRYGIVRMQLDEIAEDLFTNMADPVVLVGPDQRITRVNAAARRRFASTFAGEVLPQLSDFIDPEAMTMTAFETRTRCLDEDSLHACTVSRVERHGEHLGTILMMRDITREKEVDRMKTEFTSTVSHELRTPLTSVLGFAKLIRKRFTTVVVPRFEPETAKEARVIKQIETNLDVIISEGNRLTKLINDVLDISKMEAGKTDWNVQSHDLGAVIAQALAASSGLFSRKPAVRLVEDHMSPLPTMEVDADRIIQVLLNLISNAVKFTDEGAVTVRTERTEAALKVSVVDEGIGISTVDQSKVFEKYKQVGDQLTDRPSGTGLGLPISKEIVEYHGGRIWVESVPGQGSTFAFTLPFSTE